MLKDNNFQQDKNYKFINFIYQFLTPNDETNYMTFKKRGLCQANVY